MCEEHDENLKFFTEMGERREMLAGVLLICVEGTLVLMFMIFQYADLRAVLLSPAIIVCLGSCTENKQTG